MHTLILLSLLFLHSFIVCHDSSQSDAIYYRAALHTDRGQEVKKFSFVATIFPQKNFDSNTTTIVHVSTYKNCGTNNLSFEKDLQPQIARNVSLYFCQQHPHIQSFNLYMVDQHNTLIQRKYTLEECIINDKSVNKYDGTKNNWYGIFDAKPSVVQNAKKRKL